MKTDKNFYGYLISFLFVAMAGCGVYTKITSNYDRSIDFTKYKTFAWLPDKDTVGGEYNNQIIRNNARNYFSHCMGGRGYKISIDTPDVFLELVITAVKKEKTVSTPSSTYPLGWYYHNPYYYHYPGNHYYLHHYNYNYTTYVTQKVEYTEGAITLNVIDRKLNKLVWTGTAKGDLYDPSYIGDNLHPAVYDILENYPIKPLNGHRRPKKKM
ncbi:DUF4136 domain-containing protein [uncultured Flavobacterium sp.]|uniref:DUF4136 domain-containing protein n=1 Tax=uncultured Flavobacterium sp. TaxID=165435 RepID=UPI0030EF7953|tara:strand:- start:193 stop:828 length:636 start_codon:yes stop_codon:yes gene_type:complete